MIDNPYFSVDEMKCKGTDECHMNDSFMEKLINI